MQNPTVLRGLVCGLCCVLLSTAPGFALADDVEPSAVLADPQPSLFLRASSVLRDTVGEALSLIGIPYKRGGVNPESGFDCSGFVSHVFRQSMGLILPHNAKAMSKEGEKIDKKELQPGDLVFFNTMRRAFSHVGIYIGDGQFIHSPKPGAEVRVESLSLAYWARRFDGARRVPVESDTSDRP